MATKPSFKGPRQNSNTCLNQIAFGNASGLAAQVGNFPATVDTNDGLSGSSTLRFVLATDQPALTNPLLVTPSVPTGSAIVSSAAYEASHVLKASAGKLLFLNVYNSKGSAQFIQLFNSATVPADTAVPVMVVTVPTVADKQFSIPISGMPFTTGIAVSNSSTGPTKTIGSADCYFTAVII